MLVEVFKLLPIASLGLVRVHQPFHLVHIHSLAGKGFFDASLQLLPAHNTIHVLFTESLGVRIYGGARDVIYRTLVS